MNEQKAPYPAELAELVMKLQYRPGWVFQLKEMDRGQGSVGLTLLITIRGYDSYNVEAGENNRVNHLMPVPPAAYNQRSWRRWLFEQILLVERHEAAEFFVVDGDRPYAPHHHDGNDPYAIFEEESFEELEAGRHR